MTSLRASAIVLVALAWGCVLDAVDLGERPCPCVAGYTCDASKNRCVHLVSGPYSLTATPGPVRLRVTRPHDLDVALATEIDQTITVTLTGLPDGVSATPGALSLTRADPHGTFVVSANVDSPIGDATGVLLGTDATGRTTSTHVAFHIGDRPGVLDSSFGTGGFVAFSDVAQSFGSRVVVRPDDRIVVATEDIRDLFLAQLEADGTTDSTFGSNGRATISSGSTQIAYQIGELLLLSNGKLVLVVNENPVGASFAMRLTPTGQIDTSFGSGGMAMGTGGGCGAVRSDGRILTGGSSANHTMLVQLLPDGTLDPSFGIGGQALPNLGADVDAATAVIILPDDRIAVVGTYKTTLTHGFLAILTATGALDPSFGSGGIVVGEEDSYYKTITVAADGSLLVGAASVVFTTPPSGNFVLRYTLAGALDMTFGTHGAVEFAAQYTQLNAFTSTYFGATAFVTQTTLGEFDASGILDGSLGPTTAPKAMLFDHISHQSDSRLIVVGEPSNTPTLQVARYWP